MIKLLNKYVVSWLKSHIIIYIFTKYINFLRVYFLFVTNNTPAWTWAFHFGWPWCIDHSQGRQNCCEKTPWDVSGHSKARWHRPQIYSGSTSELAFGQLLEWQKNKRSRRTLELYFSVGSNTTLCLMWLVLTVTFGSVFQTKSNGQHSIVFKELCSKCVPPDVVTLLHVDEKKKNQMCEYWVGFVSVYRTSCIHTCVYWPPSSSVAVCWAQKFCSLSGCHMACASWIYTQKRRRKRSTVKNVLFQKVKLIMAYEITVVQQ